MKTLFSIFILLSAGIFAQTSKDSLGTGPYMELSEQSKDFGDLVQGDSTVMEFKFVNAGTKDLLVTNVYSTCGCTIPSFSKEAIAPGKEGVIKVVFNSKDKIGRQNKVVTIFHNGRNGPTKIFFSGNVLVK